MESDLVACDLGQSCTGPDCPAIITHRPLTESEFVVCDEFVDDHGYGSGTCVRCDRPRGEHPQREARLPEELSTQRAHNARMRLGLEWIAKQEGVCAEEARRVLEEVNDD